MKLSLRQHLGPISALLAVLLFIDLVWMTRDVVPSVVRAQLSFSRSGFEAVLARWSPLALQQVRDHFPIDFAFVLCFSTAGLLYGRRWLGQEPRPDIGARLLPWLLPAAGGLDVIENVLHLRFLSPAASAMPDEAYTLAGVAASCKWTLALLFLILCLRRWIRRRRSLNPS